MGQLTYLECGSNNGDPIGGAGVCKPDDVTAASGCKNFFLCSTRTECCSKHLVITDGNASNWSYKNIKLEFISQVFLRIFSVYLN